MVVCRVRVLLCGCCPPSPSPHHGRKLFRAIPRQRLSFFFFLYEKNTVRDRFRGVFFFSFLKHLRRSIYSGEINSNVILAIVERTNNYYRSEKCEIRERIPFNARLKNIAKKFSTVMRRNRYKSFLFIRARIMSCVSRVGFSIIYNKKMCKKSFVITGENIKLLKSDRRTYVRCV